MRCTFTSTTVPLSPRSLVTAAALVQFSVDLPSISLMMSPARRPTFSEGPPRTVLTMTMPSGCWEMIEPIPKKDPRCSSRMVRNSVSSM